MIKKTRFVVPKEIFNEAVSSLPSVASKLTINQPTGKFFYDPWEIKSEFKNTVWEKVLGTIPVPIGEARLIKLEPQQTYSSHADIDDRWHLAIEGDQSYLIDLDKMLVHKTESNGSWYSMDAGRIHTAANFGGLPRVQLVVRKLLLKNKIDNPISVTIEPAGDITWHRYNFDLIFSPWLNYANKLGDINEFSFDGNAVKFNIKESSLECFKGLITSDFKVTYA